MVGGGFIIKITGQESAFNYNIKGKLQWLFYFSSTLFSAQAVYTKLAFVSPEFLVFSQKKNSSM